MAAVADHAGPLDILSWFDGPQVPDPVTFAISPDWLDRPNLYPRQATMLKLIFLRDDLFTDYDREVIAEWIGDFNRTNPDAGLENKFTAETNGCQPDIYERIAFLKERGYKWFPEVILAMGRRGAKGFISALAMAYVLWNYLAKGNPQEHYGIDRDKGLAAMIFAGKKEQAKENLWGDLYSVITGAPCYTDYISDALAESLTIYAPHDFIRMRQLAARGITSAKDMATFRILPKESTLLAGRGPAGCIIGFDEAAHVKNAGTTRAFGDVYNSAKPALDQFGTDGFVVLPSSTWEMIGKFYELWQLALEREPGKFGSLAPSYPDKFMLQLPSWGTYKDWERAHLLPLFPPGYRGDLGEYDPEHLPVLQPLKGAIQAYDESMMREERANPDTFKVERRCVDLSVKILTADLTWKPAGEIEPGDQIIGFDEHAPRSEDPGKRPQRKLRTATVLHAWRVRDIAYRITFGDGSSVVCSGNHRWLSDNRWRSLFAPPGTPGPRTVMKVGDSIRWVVDPWEEDDSRDAGWLAGMYDGEGSFLGRGRDRQEYSLTITQNPGPVLDKILSTLKDKGFSPVCHSHTRRAEQWYVTNLDECLRLVGQIKPLRFYNRRHQLWEGKAIHGSHTRSRTKTIVKIEELPEQELVDIETTTGTYIADGLISHNSHWATAMDAYLNTARVNQMFAPWEGRPPAAGRPELEFQDGGPLIIDYRAHGDPSTVNNRFGFAVAHAEHGPDGMAHAVFDIIHYWDPADFENHIIDYDVVTEWIFQNVVMKFQPGELTFDQFNSVASVQYLQKRVRAAHLQKNVQVWERTATAQLNWATYETFKAAINMGLVHAPMHAEAAEELKFLQKPPGQAKIICPDSGPVQTKDIADCVAIVTDALLGEQMRAFIGADLARQRPGLGLPGGVDPYDRFSPEAVNPLAHQLGRGAMARGMRPGMSPRGLPGMPGTRGPRGAGVPGRRHRS